VFLNDNARCAQRGACAWVGSYSAVQQENFDEVQAMSKITHRGGGIEKLHGAGRGIQRESRISLRFLIEVCGFDRFGKFFTERSETSNVSRHGCKFSLKTEVAPESVVAIRVLRDKGPSSPTPPSLFQVAHTSPAREGWHAGASTLQPGDVWAVDFAALDRASDPASTQR
jgi:hypothetical protein